VRDARALRAARLRDLLIECRGSGEPLGFAGLKTVDFAAPFVATVEIAWRLARSHWGRGYATEAARAAVHFGFETLGLPELVGFTVPSNSRSIAMFQRLGMSRDPAFDFEHPKLAPAHPLRAHLFFRLTRPLAP
jgi:RimJ/RimL family protein N-acetyltransferase